jgi:hypothetical protein
MEPGRSTPIGEPTVKKLWLIAAVTKSSIVTVIDQPADEQGKPVIEQGKQEHEASEDTDFSHRIAPPDRLEPGAPGAYTPGGRSVSV